ncbi:WecB/TagA/CpsF family glycosyltransferase [Labrenzia sp. PHM005]|uniref:WecB/TagA/CpsF family glycosyltransferase n=1 Tax=Labrenzia sp. PHM005 TaxID=2590016 RepID=UPI0011407DED|nr:WecB/TagA/CpsF family glycosyltransferase [Labrenzia sp. PHM005]QDG76131.1 WecB/TagA/CpsF family glycosyltransferase [Labrenzia sp. PHM005]
MNGQQTSKQARSVQARSADAKHLAELARSYLPVKTLGGLPITWTDRTTAAETLIAQALAKRGQPAKPFYSTSANGQVVVMCSEDSAVLDEFLHADQILADGMPMVWLSKFKHKLPNVERVATTDLYHDVAEIAQKIGASFYLLGSDEESNEAAVNRTAELYPDLEIAGRRNGYFSANEEDKIVAEINKLGPDFLWVGMGVPREQQFVSRNLNKLTNVGVIKTSGGLFDFLSLKRSRAPKWMQALGLEWLYRTILEPRRLGPRYLQTNHKALFKFLED